MLLHALSRSLQYLQARVTFFLRLKWVVWDLVYPALNQADDMFYLRFTT